MLLRALIFFVLIQKHSITGTEGLNPNTLQRTDKIACSQSLGQIADKVRGKAREVDLVAAETDRWEPNIKR